MIVTKDLVVVAIIERVEIGNTKILTVVKFSLPGERLVPLTQSSQPAIQASMMNSLKRIVLAGIVIFAVIKFK